MPFTALVNLQVLYTQYLHALNAMWKSQRLSASVRMKWDTDQNFFILWLTLDQCSTNSKLKKQDTAGKWTLSWQSQECHHRSLLLFCCCCKAGKSKTWRNKPGGLFLQEKQNPSNTWLRYLHRMRISLGHKPETRRQTTGSPVPRHSPQWPRCIGWFHDILFHINKTTIPASLVMLKSCSPFATQQDTGQKQWRLSCPVYSCNERQRQFKLPPPTPHHQYLVNVMTSVWFSYHSYSSSVTILTY